MKLLLSFLMLSMSTTAFAGGPWYRFFQDIKIPSQSVLDHSRFVNPLLGTATALATGASVASGAASTIATFTAQPDVPRNILLTPTGTTSHVQAGTAVVNGISVLGKQISENFTISNQQSTATTGNAAFSKVTSIVFPAASGTGVTLNIGTGTKLGLRRCLDDAGKYVFSEFGGVYDTTRGTVASSLANVELNTFIDNSALDGAHTVDVYYIQNYRCF